MQIKQEIKRKKYPLRERRELETKGGEKRQGQVGRLELSSGQEETKG
jgi:hypothetical protein